MKFEDHKELQLCGDCPFLDITPEHEKYLDAEVHDTRSGGGIFVKEKRSNKCNVQAFWWLPNTCGDMESDICGDIDNPKRSEKCLELTKHIHNTMAKKFK